jgi:hypothetical protein
MVGRLFTHHLWSALHVCTMTVCRTCSPLCLHAAPETVGTSVSSPFHQVTAASTINAINGCYLAPPPPCRLLLSPLSPIKGNSEPCLSPHLHSPYLSLPRALISLRSAASPRWNRASRYRSLDACFARQEPSRSKSTPPREPRHRSASVSPLPVTGELSEHRRPVDSPSSPALLQNSATSLHIHHW